MRASPELWERLLELIEAEEALGQLHRGAPDRCTRNELHSFLEADRVASQRAFEAAYRLRKLIRSWGEP